ncbi:uncharacterized [Tachysurus ichikawai]
MVLWWYCGGAVVVLWWCCGGTVVVLWWCYGGTVVVLWWCCGGAVVIVITEKPLDTVRCTLSLPQAASLLGPASSLNCF